MSWRFFRLVLCLGATGLGVPARAQDSTQPPARNSTLSGLVVDDKGRPLAGALVVIDDGFIRRTTNLEGRFELSVEPGIHTVVAAKIGYRPDTVTLDIMLRRSPRADDSMTAGETRLTLIEAPQQLKGITIEGAVRPPMAHTVTAATVSNVPALAEADVLRAVSLLPGVSTPNDTRGRLHLAGGASDEVGIRLDGHPLQDPFHLFGLLGAFNVNALERADVLIHAVPPSMSDHLSGVIDLETRRPTPRTSGDMSISVLATSVSVLSPEILGMDVLASGRVTYFDKVLPLFSRKAKVGGDEVPLYGFKDAIARFGRSSGAWRFEQLFFVTSDHMPRTGEVDEESYVPYVWGERLAGFRAQRTGDAWTTNARISTGRNSVEFDERSFFGTYLSNQYLRHSGAIELSRHAERWEAMAGTSVDLRRNRYDWDFRARPEGPSPNSPRVYTADTRQTLFSYYGDLAAIFRRGLSQWRLHSGIRVVTSGAVSRASPSARVNYQPNTVINLGLAAERRYQFQGIIEEPGSLMIRPVEVLLEKPRVADVVGFSLSVRPRPLPFSATGSLRLEAFAKRYANQVRALGRDYGETDEAYARRFPQLESVPGRAVGASFFSELNLGMRAQVQSSYTVQRVRQTYDGESAPTSWDIPQQLSLFGTVDLTTRWKLGIVYQVHTGVPITPVAARVLVPVSNAYAVPGFADGPRNSLRAPPYHRLDLSAQRHWRTRSNRDWTLAFHVMNALARANPVAIDWSRYYEALDLQARGGPPVDPGITLLPSLPILPSVSLRVQW